MNDVQDLLEELAESGEARGAGAVFAGAAQRAGQRRRMRRRIGIGSTLAGVVGVVVVIVMIGQSSNTNRVPNRLGVEPDATTTTLASATAAQLAAGHWSEIPAAPMGARNGASVVWTGKELIVWGGNARYPASESDLFGLKADGAAYDPTTRSWRSLAKSPLSPRFGAPAVWTGSEMIVVGGELRSPRGQAETPGGTAGVNAAAYRPSIDAWRIIPQSPIVPTVAVWTGDRVVVFSGANGASYDPDANAWHRLPPIPAHVLAGFEVRRPLGTPLAVAAGAGRVLVWSEWFATRTTGPGETEGTGGSDVLRYDEATDGWTELSAGPDAIGVPAQAFWTGDRVLVRGDMSVPGASGKGPLPEVSALYDPDTGRATMLPPDALNANNFAGAGFTSVWTGRALMSLAPGVPPTLQTNVSAYDEASNTWRMLPGLFACYPPAPAAWTGRSVLIYCPQDPQDSAIKSPPADGLEFIPG